MPDHPAEQSLGSRILRYFKTPRNLFGLSRRFYSTDPPSHDPDELTDLEDLSDFCDGQDPQPPIQESSDAGAPPPVQNTQELFYPYPNRSSFRLGDWYWNHGVQKSQQSFQELLNIVGDTDFSPGDIRETKWSKVDGILAKNDFDEDEDQGEWLDEDAGWKRTPVSIMVPFHRRTQNPGPRSQIVVDLYHRSIVSVIREKLANRLDVQNFHYEPYDLFWKPNEATDEVRVHGELYTSAVFRDAHRELQESPGEPDCSLPRVVVGLMFWSDATHLTSFGNAKLWPCYMYFGNESKYRRCKPSCNLCSHIAYFQSVRLSLSHYFPH